MELSDESLLRSIGNKICKEGTNESSRTCDSADIKSAADLTRLRRRSFIASPIYFANEIRFPPL